MPNTQPNSLKSTRNIFSEFEKTKLWKNLRLSITSYIERMTDQRFQNLCEQIGVEKPVTRVPVSVQNFGGNLS